MLIAYRGNFTAKDEHGVPFNTEAHIAQSLDAIGHDVIEIQEGVVSWAETIRLCQRADLFLWTATEDLGNVHRADERAAIATLGDRMPTASVHLDRFWGLDREHCVSEYAWFRVQHVFTADGDNDDKFAAAGVNHHWLPPAVYHEECEPGVFDPKYAADVAFVGAWRGYHTEWQGRNELVKWLRATYGTRCAFWPQGPSVRGRELANLYASAKVIIGDSCFAATSRRYTSDRPYETVGRAGFLVYPRIECVEQELGDHCVYYTPGDWAGLKDTIDHWLEPEQDEERNRIRLAGCAHVREHCTYKNRMEQMLATVAGE